MKNEENGSLTKERQQILTSRLHSEDLKEATVEMFL